MNHNESHSNAAAYTQFRVFAESYILRVTDWLDATAQMRLMRACEGSPYATADEALNDFAATESITAAQVEWVRESMGTNERAMIPTLILGSLPPKLQVKSFRRSTSEPWRGSRLMRQLSVFQVAVAALPTSGAIGTLMEGSGRSMVPERGRRA